MSHFSVRGLLCLSLLIPIYSAAAQDMRVETVFQSLTLSTAPGFTSDGSCSSDLQAPGANPILDAGDHWMECSAYNVALPPSAGLTLESSSSTVSMSGEYSYLNADSTNGSLYINGASINSVGVASSNAYLSISSSGIYNGVLSSVNEPIQLSNVILGAHADLTNAGLTGTYITVPEGKRLVINGTNSDVLINGLACAPASYGVPAAPYKTTLKSKFKRRVTRLTGKVDLYKSFGSESRRKRSGVPRSM